MMAAVLGKIEEFDRRKEDWDLYIERLEHFFVANAITEPERKRAVFLSVIGASTYKTLRSLLSPNKPGEQDYRELVQKLSEHYSPKPSEIVERTKFHSRFRKPGESVASFVAQLRSLSEHCNFGDNLEVMIRDRLVCGINDDTIQKRLLSESKLTYLRAVELAQSLENADKNVKLLGRQGRLGNGNPQGEGQGTLVNTTTLQKGRGTTVTGIVCFRCGKPGHTVPKCRMSRTVKCHLCGKTGHVQKACKSSDKWASLKKATGSSTGATTRTVSQLEEDHHDIDPTTLFRVSSKSSIPPLEVEVKMDDCIVKMEVDTGATLSLMSETTFRTLWPRRSLVASEVRLRSYTKDPIPVIGQCNVNIVYNDQTAEQLPLIIVKGAGPSLFGRNWLNHIVLNWREIYHVHGDSLQQILDKYPSVFQEGLGTLKGYEAKIHVDPNVQPRFHRARPIPYSIRDKVEAELKRLQDEGTIEAVEHSDWATPIVPVLKPDKSVRICGDFRVTVNPVSKLDTYPIPRVEDLFASLKKGNTFTKIDLSQAYQQLPLDKESQKNVVINTHKGLFQYKRLPYGIASAPGIFQRVMENILQGLSGVTSFIDDILITAPTEEKHFELLEEVLRRLDKAGLRIKLKKCQFLQSSVRYLGHVIDKHGLHPLPDKVEAIKDAPTPRSIQELKSYLGLLTYYGKFLPNLSTTLFPLYRLLRKDFPWKWDYEEEKAFQKSKDMLTSSSLLTHFDSNLPLMLACDASAYGIGAVLAHRMPDGSEKPIGYVSRTLSKAEQNYSQLEKEGLSLVFGIKKFHSYVFGHPFELITDHKPLLGLLREDRATSPQASARIKRWSLFLSSYEYTLVFRKTSAHANADALSRLPLLVEPATTQTPPELVLLTEHLDDSPVTADDIRKWIKKDPKLSQVLQFILQGWPNHCSSDLEPFFSKRAELSTYDGCILWGTRVFIPQGGRDAVLQELHGGHPGISKMKAMARMYVWWPGIDSDIEKTVRLCGNCQEVQSSPPIAPLNPWRWPTRPWSRLHADFAGPFENKMFLILIDAHSKWIEAFQTSNATSRTVIDELRTVFARFGIPEMIVTDNGSCFVSEEFESYLSKNGIKHTTSAPHHPASNGLAERAVQIVKRGLKKDTSGDIKTRLARVLFNYRMTPQSTTGVSPSELLLGRRPRTRLDLLRPNTAERVEQKQHQQKVRHDTNTRVRTFGVGNTVFVKNFGPGRKWLPGKVTKVTGPVSYQVKLTDGRHRRCHVDQLRIRILAPNSVPEVFEPKPVEDLGIPYPEPEEPTEEPQTSVSQPNLNSPVPNIPPEPASESATGDSTTTTTPPVTTQPQCTYPSRNHARPDYYHQIRW